MENIDLVGLLCEKMDEKIGRKKEVAINLSPL